MIEVMRAFAWYLIKFAVLLLTAAGGIYMGKTYRDRNGLCRESRLYGELDALYRSRRECTGDQYRECMQAASGYEEADVSHAISLVRGARCAGFICIGVSVLLIGFLSYCAGIVFRLRPGVFAVCLAALAAVVALFIQNAGQCIEYEYLLSLLEDERARRRREASASGQKKDGGY